MQEQLKVKIKKLHPNAVVPRYSNEGDAGLDLVATTMQKDSQGNICYGTGLAFEIPEGYVGFVFPRSSNSKKDLLLTNSVGVIDSCYRGEVSFKFAPYRKTKVDRDPMRCDRIHVPLSEVYEVNDRIGQLIIMPYPKVSFEEVDELSETIRGEGGYGSTGR